MSNDRTFQVALNGGTVHPAMPLTPDQIAEDAAACVAAGANLLHLHAYDDDGVETLAEPAVTRVIQAVRRRCPGVPISMTTFAQIEPDPARRLETIAA
ncbi:3-keto-5-aminohexanoate cleavage protein, partial [Aeromicrobium alkaliterrae]